MPAHVYIHTYIHTCIHTYMHACMHTYITYIHTVSYIFRLICFWQKNLTYVQTLIMNDPNVSSDMYSGKRDERFCPAINLARAQLQLAERLAESWHLWIENLKKLFVLCLQSILGVNYPAKISQIISAPFWTGCTWVHYTPGLTCLFLGAKLPPDSFHHHLHPRCIKWHVSAGAYVWCSGCFGEILFLNMCNFLKAKAP
jgi:hypothetical protein